MTRRVTSGCSTAPKRGSPTVGSPTSTSWSRPWTIRARVARGQASFIVGRRARRVSVDGPESSPNTASAQATPPRCFSTTSEIPGRSGLLGGRDGTARGPDSLRAREGKPILRRQAAMKTFEATRPAVAAQAVGIARAAYEVRARVREGTGSSSAGRSSMNQADRVHASPTWRPRSTRRGCWCGARRGWRKNEAAQPTAEGSMSKLKAGRVATCGPPSARCRFSAAAGYVDRPPRRAVPPRRQDLRHLRRHRADPTTSS